MVNIFFRSIFLIRYQIIQKTFGEDEKCGLQELRVSFFKSSDPWLAMKRGNPYSELFKIGWATEQNSFFFCFTKFFPFFLYLSHTYF